MKHMYSNETLRCFEESTPRAPQNTPRKLFGCQDVLSGPFVVNRKLMETRFKRHPGRVYALFRHVSHEKGKYGVEPRCQSNARYDALGVNGLY